MAWSWGAVKGFDKGYGVTLSATWLLSVAVVPGTWEPPKEEGKEGEDEKAKEKQEENRDEGVDVEKTKDGSGEPGGEKVDLKGKGKAKESI